MPRYSDLIAQIPTGTFYSSQGSVVSNLDHPYPMRIDTKTPSDTFGVFVNNVYQFEIVTDADGIALFSVTLPKGENVIKLVNKMTQQPINTYLTVRDWATWLTAYAGQLDQFDLDIDTIRRNSRLLEVNYEMADPVWGSRLLTNDSPAYPIDTYREVLQAVQQGYRRFGGITGGLDEVVAAFLQVNPWMVPTTFGPRWVLGTDFIDNRFLMAYPYGLRYAWGDLDPSYPGNLTITYNQSYSPVQVVGGNALPIELNLTWDPATPVWIPDGTPDGTTVYERRFTYTDNSQGPLSTAVSLPVPPSGVFNETLEAIFRGAVYSLIGPFDTSVYHWLGIDFGFGAMSINLPQAPGTTAAAIASTIQTSINNDPRYISRTNPNNTVVVSDNLGYITIATAGDYDASIVPPVNLLGNAQPNAAVILFGVPWVIGSITGVTPMSMPPPVPPSGPPTVVFGVSGGLGEFPTPTYPGAYSVNVIYHVISPSQDILLTLPVLAVDKSGSTITTDFSAYMGLGNGNITLLTGFNDIYPSTQAQFKLHNRTVTSKITINIADTSVLNPTTPNTLVNYFDPPADAGMGEGTQTQWGTAPVKWINEMAWNFYGVSLGVTDGWFRPSALVMTSQGDYNNWTLTTQVNPSIHDWSGFIGECGVWVGRMPSTATQDAMVTVTLNFISYENGTISTYEKGGFVGVDMHAPTQINVNYIIPPPLMWDYATVSVSLWNVADSGGISLRIDEVYFKVWTHTGVNLGFNTIPRNAKRGMRGYMLYAWCPDDITSAEDALLGLFPHSENVDPIAVADFAELRAIPITPTFGNQRRSVVDVQGFIYQYNPNAGANDADDGSLIIKPNNIPLASNGRWYYRPYPVGHISTVSPDQVTIDRFNMTIGHAQEIDNVVGVFTDTDFALCSTVNLDIVPRAPTRFSYLRPTNISAITDLLVYPEVNPDGPVPGWVIYLPEEWDANLDTVVLYEDAGEGPIPVTHDNLIGLDPTTIGLFNWTAGATYTINYNRLTQVTTPALSLPDAMLAYQWWADWVTFRILDMTPQTVPILIGLQFDGNLIATLNTRSNLDVSQSLMLRDDGKNVTPVPSSQWSYLNANTIRLSSQAFDSNSTYTLNYFGRVIHPEPQPIVKVEIRQGKTQSECLLAAWETLPHYNINVKTLIGEIDGPQQEIFPWFQMRMTVENIQDTRFLRIQSLLMKGIPVNLWGNKFVNRSLTPSRWFYESQAQTATLQVAYVPKTLITFDPTNSAAHIGVDSVSNTISNYAGPVWSPGSGGSPSVGALTNVFGGFGGMQKRPMTNFSSTVNLRLANGNPIESLYLGTDWVITIVMQIPSAGWGNPTPIAFSLGDVMSGTGSGFAMYGENTNIPSGNWNIFPKHGWGAWAQGFVNNPRSLSESFSSGGLWTLSNANVAVVSACRSSDGYLHVGGRTRNLVFGFSAQTDVGNYSGGFINPTILGAYFNNLVLKPFANGNIYEFRAWHSPTPINNSNYSTIMGQINDDTVNRTN